MTFSSLIRFGQSVLFSGFFRRYEPVAEQSVPKKRQHRQVFNAPCFCTDSDWNVLFGRVVAKRYVSKVLEAPFGLCVVLAAGLPAGLSEVRGLQPDETTTDEEPGNWQKNHSVSRLSTFPTPNFGTFLRKRVVASS